MEHDKGAATRARILGAALDLFNAEGASAHSALDIATAIGISPGHLYYHFRGKAEILFALVQAHAGEMDEVLAGAMAACRAPGATFEDLWTQIRILAEEAWDARFLYREAGALALRHPDVASAVRRLLAVQRAALREMLGSLAGAGVLSAAPEVMDGLSRVMCTAVSFQAVALELEGDPGPARARVARAAAQIMLPLLPLRGAPAP